MVAAWTKLHSKGDFWLKGQRRRCIVRWASQKNPGEEMDDCGVCRGGKEILKGTRTKERCRQFSAMAEICS